VSERFYTVENVLDLVQRVFNITVVSNKDKTEWISRIAFPGKTPKDGWMVMANAGKGKDHYDGLYSLLYQIAKTKHDGVVPNGVMKLRAGESDPIEVAINLIEEKRIMEAE